MELGKTVNLLRKEKTIPIKDLCGDYISRSAYARFVSSKTDTSAINFLQLLEALHVTYDEFEYIKNGRNKKESERLLFDIQDALSNQNKKQLFLLNKECCILKKNNNDIYHHLACMCILYINKLNDEEYDVESISIILNYLMSIETWTHYEVVLFNNVMFSFDLELIELVLNRAVNNLNRYSQLNKYSNDSFRMLLNLLTLYLSNKNIQKANYIFNIIDEYNLKEEWVYERLLKKFFREIINLVVKENYDSIAEIQNILSFFKYLDMNKQYAMHKHFFELIEVLYDIEKTTTENM